MRALCERVGERVWVLLDEALADFLEPGEDAAGLVAELPNLLVFRTFAKAHAMAGFRIGYVLGPGRDGRAPHPLLLGQRARAGGGRVVARARRRLCSPAAAPPPCASATGSPPRCTAPRCPSRRPPRRSSGFSSDEHSGRAIAEHLGLRRIKVAAGEQWGDERHVRITLRDAAATDRLVAALRELG